MTLDPIYCLTIMVKNNPSSGKAPVEASIEIKVEDGGYSDDLIAGEPHKFCFPK